MGISASYDAITSLSRPQGKLTDNFLPILAIGVSLLYLLYLGMLWKGAESAKSLHLISRNNVENKSRLLQTSYTIHNQIAIAVVPVTSIRMLYAQKVTSAKASLHLKVAFSLSVTEKIVKEENSLLLSILKRFLKSFSMLDFPSVTLAIFFVSIMKEVDHMLWLPNRL